ncbi:hypothetical protein L484_016782 [Morus notabilis]|uniref:Uncharacterized protein n=1 Tax=Morus notabilis TaxID=981085 RepID=W9S4F8_9ROSA|nr:hypothetical protein L484_016782 [Morus notabilis]
MADSNQEKQDQRSSSSMEDSQSTAMTIEFLRARLLSERSVSRSARQRADELEKRVEELEEQLRIVSLQRKMAEKATVDVLSILENHGISDASETYDSGSDQETHQVANNYANGEERSVVSKRRSVLEELSGSDLDSSPINGRSLSWKGRSDSSRSREKYKDSSVRRQNALSSSFGSSSPKHYVGKSCRQIRCRETRTVVEDHKTEPLKFDSQENGAATPPEGSVKNDRRIPNHLDVNGHGQEKDMKKALEHRAQLIGQYEEMEKAQREWEEKYRENNTSTPDSYDPGNHSDVTEDRDEVKAQTLYNVGIDIAQAVDAKSNKVDLSKESSKPQSNGFLHPTRTRAAMGDLKVQASSNIDPVASRFQAQEFAFPTAKEKEAQESLENRDFRPSESPHHGQLLHRSLPNQPFDRGALSDAGSSSHKRDFSGSQNDLYALVPHNPPVVLGGVLDALKQAKLSLQQKINRLPLEGTTTQTVAVNRSIEPTQPGTRVGDRLEIPVGCTGLFRLPTDFATVEASTQANFLSSGSRLSLEPYYPDNKVALTAPDRFLTSPYIESRSEFPPDVRFLTSSSVVSGSRASTLNSRFDSHFDTGPSSVNRYSNYPPHPSYPPFPDSMPRIPSDEGLRRPFRSSRSFGLPEDRFSFYDDHGRPNMYR